MQTSPVETLIAEEFRVKNAPPMCCIIELVSRKVSYYDDSY